MKFVINSSVYLPSGEHINENIIYLKNDNIFISGMNL